MEKLQKKLKKQGGFTLVEMLIVVAIIAILIAVSIPMVSGALDRAKQATDAANVRAGKAQASITKLDPEYKIDGAEVDWGDDTNPTVYAYDADKGMIVKTASIGSINPYGKVDPDDKQIIYLAIYKDVVYYKWGKTEKAETFTPGSDGSAATGWSTNPAGDTTTP